MAYHQDVCCFTKSKNYESILFFRMIRIITHQGVVIIEDARSLFKRYAVFFNVYLCFFGILLEFHNYMVIMKTAFVKWGCIY